MKKIIIFDTVLSREFRVINNWPIPDSNDTSFVTLPIEFEHVEGNDVMKEASDALDIHMKANYGDKDYRITYWWWPQ